MADTLVIDVYGIGVHPMILRCGRSDSADLPILKEAALRLLLELSDSFDANQPIKYLQLESESLRTARDKPVRMLAVSIYLYLALGAHITLGRVDASTNAPHRVCSRAVLEELVKQHPYAVVLVTRIIFPEISVASIHRLLQRVASIKKRSY